MSSRQGNLQFDKLTKTKTVETLFGKVRKATHLFYGMLNNQHDGLTCFLFVFQLQGSGLDKLASWFIESFNNGTVGNAQDET